MYRVLRGRDAPAIARFIGNLRVIGAAVLAPAPVLVIGMGTWLVLATPTWSFDQPWLTLGLTFFGIAFLIGVAHQSQAALGAERAVGRGDHEAAAKHLRRWSWGSRVILVLLLAATWTMVFKPGQ